MQDWYTNVTEHAESDGEQEFGQAIMWIVALAPSAFLLLRVCVYGH